MFPSLATEQVAGGFRVHFKNIQRPALQQNRRFVLGQKPLMATHGKFKHTLTTAPEKLLGVVAVEIVCVSGIAWGT
jgi:hypothetical protein